MKQKNEKNDILVMDIKREEIQNTQLHTQKRVVQKIGCRIEKCEFNEQQ